jgi:hypothetical protein
MWTAIAIVGLVLAFLYFERQRELFLLSVRGGRTLLVRGRIPRSLHIGMQEVVTDDPPVASASIRGVRGEGGARLVVRGDIDEGRAQRLLNVFALFPVSRLSAAERVSNRTLGQVLGIVWLAWLLDRRA